MKKCHKCTITKDDAGFCRDRSRKDGLSNKCKECERAYQKKNRKKLTINELARRRKVLYGVSVEEFKRMFDEQGGVCAICSRPGGGNGLGVDHDHESKKVRALLCGPCNVGLGMFNDSSAVVQTAADYLKRHQK